MKIKSFVFIVSLCITQVFAQNNLVRLHTIDEMNKEEHNISSHKGFEQYSVLEPIYKYSQLIPSKKLKTDGTAIYPRIKKMANGRYIMFCQGGQIASNIYYYISDDLKEWSEGKTLFTAYPVTTSLGDDKRCFSTADAVVLDNGEIIVVCSFRASAGYKHSIGCGIMMRRSTDNGITWSDEKIIYEGPNWEPYLIQLPDKRIQCYFTDCNPKQKNSGTSLISSFDYGNSWQGYMRVSRQYKYNNPNGIKIYTDQMPCFKLLNNKKTLLGFLEGRLELDSLRKKSTFKMSVIRNDAYSWKPLGENSPGPSDRDTNLFEGCAGYISVFPSGETLLSCNINRLFSLKLGDSTGRRFNGKNWNEGWLKPFSGLGFWGSTEIIDSHRVIGTMHCDKGIQLGVFYLNHIIKAHKCKINVDGNGKEWKSDEALFIGSDSSVETIFCACHDSKKMYLLVECASEDNTYPEIFLSIDNKENNINLTLGKDGLIHDNTNKVKCKTHIARSISGKEGYVAEVSIPLSEIKIDEKGLLALYAKVGDDSFTFSKLDDINTWMHIILDKKSIGK